MKAVLRTAILKVFNDQRVLYAESRLPIANIIADVIVEMLKPILDDAYNRGYRYGYDDGIRAGRA